MSNHKPGKLLSLEGLRGIAAVMVLMGHMVRGLVPPSPGPLDPLNRVHSWVLNGGASVTIFFVLSGFILTLPFAKDRSRTRIITAFLKRWPRLVGLTVLGCLLSWGLILLCGDDYQRAAALTGNGWMSNHFNAPLQGYDTSFLAALLDGLYGVFLFGDVRFDSPLWTMRIELFGSFATFLAAPLLFALKDWRLRLGTVAVLLVLAGATPPMTYVSDFLVGTVLAMLVTEDRLPSLTNLQAAGALVAGLYLYCFSAGPVPFLYAPLKALLPAHNEAHFVWEVSASLFILVLLGNPALREAFSKPWAVKLGELSFPLYLMHVPVMLSAGAATILATQAALGLPGAVLLAAAVTVAVTTALAVPLALADRAWTSVLAHIFKPRA